MGKRKTQPDSEPTNERGLTDKQQAFINEYFLCGFNQTEAYRRAGYEGDYNTLAANASRMIRNDKVKAEIEHRMAEYGMTANEAIARLAKHARGDLADVFLEDGEFDFRDAKKAGQTALIKKLKRKRITRGRGDNQYSEDYFEIELYDAQAAQLAILKQWHLDNGDPTERVLLSWSKVITPDDSDPFA